MEPAPATAAALTQQSAQVTRRARPCISEGGAHQPKMTFMELLQSRRQLPAIPDSRSLKRAEALTAEWSRFYETASREEKEIAFPSLVRFVDRLCELAYSTNELSHGSRLIAMLESLAPVEPDYVLSQLIHISKTHNDGKIALDALNCAESSFGLMLSIQGRASFNAIWKVLDIYEKNPGLLARISAQEFAKTASSYLFARKDYLLNNGYKSLLAYGIAWGVGIRLNDRIKFMEDISDGKEDSFKTTLLTRVIVLAQSFPAGSPCRFEAPPSSGLAEEFPEIARVEENRIKMAEIQETWAVRRIVETANALLAYSGKQFLYAVSPSGSTLQ